eukprot:4107572-Alexandrium_andersonii.AAC.1
MPPRHQSTWRLSASTSLQSPACRPRGRSPHPTSARRRGKRSVGRARTPALILTLCCGQMCWKWQRCKSPSRFA